MDNPKIIKLVGMYARVSTAKQEDEGTIETQIEAVKDFAKKSGYTIVREYKDDGWSGDILARPALDQLRQDAKTKLWDAVLIYDPSRLSRRYSYQQLVIDELREGGTEPLFVTTPPPKNAEEKIMQGVHGIFAEYERAKIAERFRLGKLRKAGEGHIVTSVAKYGYSYIPKLDKVHGRYEVNESEARVVRMIFEWVDQEKLTIRKIVKRLQELKILPRKSKRGVWSTSTLSTLLRDKTYLGEAHFLRTYAVIPNRPFKKEGYKRIKKTSRKIRPESEWIMIPVPSIIERALFERVQQQLKDNFAVCQRNKKNEYLLAGKIWCTCGKRRAGEGPQRGKHLYYRCTGRIASYPYPAVCKEAGMNARLADSLVWERITSLMSSPELMQRQISKWGTKQQVRVERAEGSVEELRKSIGKLKNEEERYSRAYGAGAFDVEQLKIYTAPIRERIAMLENELLKASTQRPEGDSHKLPSAEDVALFAQWATKTLQSLNFGPKRDIVMSVVGKAFGTKDELSVEGRIPINIPNQVKYEIEHRHSANTTQHESGKFIPFSFTIRLTQKN